MQWWKSAWTRYGPQSLETNKSLQGDKADTLTTTQGRKIPVLGKAQEQYPGRGREARVCSVQRPGLSPAGTYAGLCVCANRAEEPGNTHPDTGVSTNTKERVSSVAAQVGWGWAFHTEWELLKGLTSVASSLAFSILCYSSRIRKRSNMVPQT